VRIEHSNVKMHFLVTWI